MSLSKVAGALQSPNWDYELSLEVQVHHPQCLEWVGVPESARLLSRPSAEWLQVMSREQTLHTALQF